MRLHPINADLVADSRVQCSEVMTEICEATIGMYGERVPELPWVGYLAEVEGDFVGACAFKTSPMKSGVEIAYFTFPGHEGQGIATQMAQRLLELAAENGVARVRAQTLPERNASVRILEKLGFVYVGIGNDDEVGEVWDWCRQTSSL